MVIKSMVIRSMVIKSMVIKSVVISLEMETLILALTCTSVSLYGN